MIRIGTEYTIASFATIIASIRAINGKKTFLSISKVWFPTFFANLLALNLLGSSLVLSVVSDFDSLVSFFFLSCSSFLFLALSAANLLAFGSVAALWIL